MGMGKRGVDHTWQVVRYKDDTAFYAKCNSPKCGYHYNCGSYLRDSDSSLLNRQIPTLFYPYCPVCGARKLRYNDEPILIDKFSWDEGKVDRRGGEDRVWCEMRKSKEGNI